MVECIGDEGKINVQNDIEAVLRREYPAIYRSDIQFEETYKRHFRKREEIERESPKLISYILSTIRDDAKDKLLSQPNYTRANNTYDPLLLWNTIEQVFALQGRYSDVTIRTKYINYFQKEDLFDFYVVKTKEMLETLHGLGIVYDNASVVTQFLTRMVSVCDVWDNKVHLLLATIPLPPLDEVIKQLMSERQVMKAWDKPHPDDIESPYKRKIRSEVPVLKV